MRKDFKENKALDRFITHVCGISIIATLIYIGWYEEAYVVGVFYFTYLLARLFKL
jgi:hypothetical protein